MKLALGLSILLITIVPALAQSPEHPAASPSAILLPGMGHHHHPIATTNPEAQKFFDQGLTLSFGFNRAEAVRSFRRASELDPKSPMPYWGIGLAFGPHLNMNIDMDVEQNAAFDAIQQALVLSRNASDYERAYVRALARRCTRAPKTDQAKLEADYKDAMAGLVKAYPDDLDAASLYAESLMDLHRYEWYDAAGNPTEHTAEILSVLEGVLRRDPEHPLANHLYVHVLDTSPHPEYALSAAQRLVSVVPGVGHLVHMSGHIFLNVGDYEMAARVNEQAAQADRDYMKLTGVGANAYTLSYYPHHVHFIAHARAEQGRFREAKGAADLLVAHVAPSFSQMPEMIDYYMRVPFLVLLRFQRWDEVLSYPEPDPKMVMTVTLWRYARGVAFAAKGNRRAAGEEQRSFDTTRKTIPPGTMFLFNPADRIMEVASTVLAARLAPDDRAAIPLWRKAVSAQDALSYDEPPAWYYPVRESLGGALLRNGQAEEAEAVFREDLRRNPRSPRALFGLWHSLKKQGKTADAEWVQRQFEEAWKKAETELRIEDL